MNAPSIPIIQRRVKASYSTLQFWWSPPLCPNGTILSYTLICSSINNVLASSTIQIIYNPSTFSATVSNLTNRVNYGFQLATTNQYGTSPFVPFELAQPGTISFGPTSVTASTLNNNLSTAVINWTFSQGPNEGLNHYFVLRGIPSTSTATISSFLIPLYPDQNSLTIGSLSTMNYNFVVQSLNDAGYSYPFQSSFLYIGPDIHYKPSQLSSLTLWLDAYTYSSLTFYSQTNKIEMWTDKSASGINYAPIRYNNAPIYDFDSQYNNNGLYFPNSSNAGLGPLNPTLCPFSTNSNFTIFTVHRYSTVATSSCLWSIIPSTNGIFIESVNNTLNIVNGAFTFSTTSSINTWDGVGCFTNFTDTATGITSMSYYANGTLIPNNPFTISSLDISSSFVNVGMFSYNSLFNPTNSFSGWLYEFLVFDIALPTIDRQLIEGYLACKWTLNNKLPLNHPYRYNYPIITSPTNSFPTNITNLSSIQMQTGFEITWLGGIGVISYAFILNGSPVTPSSLVIGSGIGGTIVTWSQSTTNPFTSNSALAIKWNGSYWLAGAKNSSGICIAKSSDGFNWVNATVDPFSGGQVNSFSWNGTYWVAVGKNSNSTISITQSTDGLNWVASTNNPFNPNGSYSPIASAVEWNGTYWIATAYSNTAVCIALSTDGLNWTLPSTPDPFTGGGSCFSIAWNGSYWTAVGQTANLATTIIISVDGNNWTAANINPFTGRNGLAVVWNGTYWIAQGYSSSSVVFAKSTDGLNWSVSGNNPFIYCQTVLWTGTQWTSTGADATNEGTFATSNDGLNWYTNSEIGPFSGGKGLGLGWNGSYYIAVGYNSNKSICIAVGNPPVVSSAIFTNLIPGANYTLVIVGKTSDPLCYTVTNTLTETILPTPLVSVQFSNVTTTSFTVSWSGGVGATYYTYLFNSILTIPTFDNGIAAQNAVFTGLNPGQSYTLLITAETGNPAVNISTSLLNITLLPSPITNVTFSNSSSSGFTVTWQGGTGATSYTYLLNNNQVTPSTDNGISNQSANFTNLSSGQPYNLVIIANTLDSNVYVLSNQSSITLSPSQITGVTFSSITTTSFTVNWLGGVGAAAYSYSINGIITAPSVDNGVVENNASFTGLSPGHTYNLIITAITATPNVFIFSSISPVTLPPTSITGVNFSNITTLGFTVSWSGGVGASSYSYSINGGSSTTIPSIDNGLSGQYATFTGLTYGQTYNVVIIAQTGNPQVFVQTISAPVTLLVTAITSVRFSNLTPSSFTVSWSGGLGAASYTYSLDNGQTNVAPTIDNGLSAHSALFSNLTAGKTYIVIITANTSNSQVYVQSVPTSQTLGPSPITNLVFSSVSTTGFTVKWSGGVGALSYSYSLNGGISTTIPSTDNGVLSQTAIFTSLNPGQTYYLVITATVGIISVSSQLTQQTLPPTAITGVNFTNVSVTSFTVNWSGGDTATSYTYTINGNQIIPTTDNGVLHKNAIFTNLISGLAYSVIITSNTGVSSVYTSSITVAETLPPIPITDIVFGNISISSFAVQWTGGTVASSYTYSLNGGSTIRTATIDNGLSAQNATFAGLMPGITYYLLITANTLNPLVNAISAVVPVTTAVVPITGLNFSSIGYNGFTVQWSGGNGVTSYSYLLNNSSSTGPSTDNGLASNQIIYSGLNASTAYSVIINGILNGQIVVTSSGTVNTISEVTPISGVSFTNITSSGFQVSWSGGTGVTSYTYLINNSAVPSPTSDHGLASNYIVYSSLNRGMTYTIVINGLLNGSVATTASGTVMTTVS